MAAGEQWNLLTASGYTAEYYDQHRALGLDYLGHGSWQRDYGHWLVNSLHLRGTALDVGCACGSIAAGLAKAGLVVHGVDLCEHMVRLGRAHFPRVVLDVCDAANLHLFRDFQFDFIHAAQSAEHWQPRLVPAILEELARVTRPGGLFFCSLDTQELYDRQKRDPANEDPTHACIKPLEWWHIQLGATGWVLATEKHRQALTDHPLSFLRRYDWDWWVAERE